MKNEKLLYRALVITLLMFVFGCTPKDESDPFPKIEEKKETTLSVLIEQVSSKRIKIGVAEVQLLEFKACYETQSDICTYAGLVLDKANNVIDLQWDGFLLKDEQSRITVDELNAAKNKSKVVSDEITVDLQTIRKNLLALNAQYLSLCRGVNYWQKLVNLAIAKRTAVYFQFATDKFNPGRTVIRADAESGSVTALKHFHIAEPFNKSISFLLNLSDSNRSLTQDNALLAFEGHRVVCVDYYEREDWSLRHYLPDDDEAASRYINGRLEMDISSGRLPMEGDYSLSGFSKLSLNELLNLKVDTRSADYFKPHKFDEYWELFEEKDLRP